MLGVDLESVRRFKLNRNHTFVKKCFTIAEIDYAYSRTNPAMHMAGFFCSKEAYCKALGKSVSFLLVEIRHEASGKPLIYFKGKKAPFAVSISHTKNMAVAVVMRSK